MPEIYLDPDTHIYYVDGVPVRDSATGILKKLGYVDDTFYTPYGQKRGRLAHKVAKLHLDGELDESSVDPALSPYFHAVLSFLADTGFVVTRTEFIVYCAELDYAATCDGEGYFPQSPALLYLLEWKSGKMMDWTRYQLALEVKALGKPRRRVGVELRKNGTYKMKHFTDPSDEAVILYGLKKYREGAK